MDLAVQIVPLEYVPTVFPYVEEYIDNALQFASCEYTADETRVYLINGMWELMVAVDENNFIHGCVVIQYHNRPRDRVAFVVAFGGRGVMNRDVFSQFIQLVQTRGATCIEGGVRKSVSRLLKRYSFNEKSRIVEFTI